MSSHEPHRSLDLFLPNQTSNWSHVFVAVGFVVCSCFPLDMWRVALDSDQSTAQERGAPSHTPLTMSLGQPGGCYLHPSWLLFHPQLAPLIYLLILWSCSLQGGLSEGWCFSLPHPGKARTRGLGGYDKCVPTENRCMVSSAEVVYAFSLCKLALPGRERLLGRHNPERQPSLDTPETGFPF